MYKALLHLHFGYSDLIVAAEDGQNVSFGLMTNNQRKQLPLAVHCYDRAAGALTIVSSIIPNPATTATNRLLIYCRYISTSSNSPISHRRLKLSLSLPKESVLDFFVHGGYELSLKCVYTARIYVGICSRNSSRL